jgi:hypothetical protein
VLQSIDLTNAVLQTLLGLLAWCNMIANRHRLYIGKLKGRCVLAALRQAGIEYLIGCWNNVGRLSWNRDAWDMWLTRFAQMGACCIICLDR